MYLVARLIGYPLLVLASFLISAQVIGTAIGPLIGDIPPAYEVILLVVVTAVIYASALGLVLLVSYARDASLSTSWRQLLGIDGRPAWSHVGKAAFTYPAYFGTLIVIMLLLQLVFPGLIDLEQAQETGYNPATFTSWYQYVLAFIGLVVLPPIFEELLFRGYLFGKLRGLLEGRAGFWVSALTTSALFGAVHGQWNVGIDTFILSMYLSYLREWTGSLWPAIMLHALKNGLAYILLFIAPLLGWQLLQ